jgi:peptidoglycan/LPS O-acetylase OafA/YrhL
VNSPKYNRPEINGLRAVSVIMICLFHANQSLLPGGYVGVDVFFVISGYLITTLIIREQSKGKFNIFEFYERRARRIFPALILVVFTSLMIGSLILFPYELIGLSESAIASVFAVSNLYFWLNIDYFSKDAVIHPLLHTWSLGVEEQFYVFFPILFVLFASKLRVIFFLIFGISSISLLAAQLGGNLSIYFPYYDQDLKLFSQPSWASFYLPVGRVWELLSGAMLAIYMFVKRSPKLSQPTSDLLSLVGLLTIVGSAFYLDENSRFPSIYTMIPVLGTVLVIRFSESARLFKGILSFAPLVGLGLISYSAYLWHWPLLTFWQLYYPGDLSGIFICVYFIVIFGISLASWKFVELPFRNKHSIPRKKFGISIIFGSLFILVAAGFLTFKEGSIGLYAKEDHDLVRITPKMHSQYINRKFYSLNSLEFSNQNSKNILIIGDSYAKDFVNILNEMNILNDDLEVVTAYVNGICQMHYVDDDLLVNVPKAYRESCKTGDSITNYIPLIRQADHIVLASSWKTWSAQRIHDTISNLELRDDQDILIVGSKYFGNINTRKFIGMKKEDKIRLRRLIKMPVNKTLSDGLQPKNFFDPLHVLCGPEYNCPIFTGDAKLISYDGGHLTAAGARFLGRRFASSAAIQRLVIRSD